MTEPAGSSTEAPPRKRKGKGAGKPPPAVVFNGGNIIPPAPPKKWEPTVYSEGLADRICAWLSAGKSLRSFCLQEGTPSTTAVMKWTRENAVFGARYAHARDEGYDRIAELAHDETAAAAGLPPEKVPGAKLAFEGRKWYVAKLAPNRYGDRLEAKHEITGPGGGPLQAHVLLDVLLTPANLERLDDIEIAAIRSAAAKLVLPAPSQIIEAVATPVAEAVAGVAYGAVRDGAAALDEAELADDTPSEE
jgi:hypothetical protein